MQCPHCHSQQTRKSGRVKEKQRYHCRECNRYFQGFYEDKGYHPDVKRICLNMYLKGMGLRGIERVTGIHHTTLINWVRESEAELPEDEVGESPTIAELDELQTYVGKKKFKVWVWTAINHYSPGILAMTVGDRSGKTFSQLWQRIKAWGCKRYMTDGYCIYANLIDINQH